MNKCTSQAKKKPAGEKPAGEEPAGEKPAGEKPAGEEPAGNTPLMFEDHRLKRQYSVMEFAKLAAVCRGDDHEERIEDAITLLREVESLASYPEKNRLRLSIFRECKVRGCIPPDVSTHVEGTAESIVKKNALEARTDQILSAVERDEKTKKIKRSSLTLEICKEAKIGKTIAHSNRKFIEWARYDWDLKHDLYCGIETDKISFEEHMSYLESRTWLKLINSDEIARSITREFLEWLEEAPRPISAALIHSRKDGTKGQLVSPKNHGAARADGTENGKSKTGKPRKRAQYKPKPVTTVEEHDVPSRNRRT